MDVRKAHQKKSFRNLKTPKAMNKGKGKYKVAGVRKNIKVERKNGKVILQEGTGPQKNVRIKSQTLGKTKIGKSNKYIVESKVTIDGKTTTFTCDMKNDGSNMQLPPEMIARVYAKQKTKKSK